MSKTPQTDAQPIQFVRVADVNGTERMEPYVPAEAMRRIERAYFQICCEWADMEVALHEAKRDRDEAHGALVAQDRRMIAAGHKCGIPFEVFGCDWPDRVAEELIAVAKERNEAREALREIAELVQRDGAWDTPNDISGSLVTIDDICEEAAK